MNPSGLKVLCYPPANNSLDVFLCLLILNWESFVFVLQVWTRPECQVPRSLWQEGWTLQPTRRGSDCGLHGHPKRQQGPQRRAQIRGPGTPDQLLRP